MDFGGQKEHTHIEQSFFFGCFFGGLRILGVGCECSARVLRRVTLFLADPQGGPIFKKYWNIRNTTKDINGILTRREPLARQQQIRGLEGSLGTLCPWLPGFTIWGVGSLSASVATPSVSGPSEWPGGPK